MILNFHTFISWHSIYHLCSKYILHWKNLYLQTATETYFTLCVYAFILSGRGVSILSRSSRLGHQNWVTENQAVRLSEIFQTRLLTGTICKYFWSTWIMIKIKVRHRWKSYSISDKAQDVMWDKRFVQLVAMIEHSWLQVSTEGTRIVYRETTYHTHHYVQWVVKFNLGKIHQ